MILFGSVATGDYDEESDIDLIVVLDSEKISQNHEEKMENKMFVRKAIRDISEEIPIDLLSFTKKEFEIIMKILFSKKSKNKGKYYMKKQAESWLQAVYSDLIVIEEIVDSEDISHMVAFHSQQAIEKSLKQH